MAEAGWSPFPPRSKAGPREGTRLKKPCCSVRRGLLYQLLADDVEFEGSSFEFAPEQAVQCDQAVEQAAAASS